jgi:hypothetical protein
MVLKITFSKLWAIADKMLIGHKLGGNFWSLLGFRGGNTLASFQDVLVTKPERVMT